MSEKPLVGVELMSYMINEVWRFEEIPKSAKTLLIDFASDLKKNNQKTIKKCAFVYFFKDNYSESLGRKAGISSSISSFSSIFSTSINQKKKRDLLGALNGL